MIDTVRAEQFVTLCAILRLPDDVVADLTRKVFLKGIRLCYVVDHLAQKLGFDIVGVDPLMISLLIF